MKPLFWKKKTSGCRYGSNGTTGRCRCVTAQDVLTFLLDILTASRPLEEILTLAGEAFSIQIGNMGQDYLLQLTILAYLGHLLDEGRIAAHYAGNRQVFTRS